MRLWIPSDLPLFLHVALALGALFIIGCLVGAIRHYWYGIDWEEFLETTEAHDYVWLSDQGIGRLKRTYLGSVCTHCFYQAVIGPDTPQERKVIVRRPMTSLHLRAGLYVREESAPCGITAVVLT